MIGNSFRESDADRARQVDAPSRTYMIKTIIFDLGGVIVPFEFSRAYRGMEKLFGVPVDVIRTRFSTSDLPVRLETGCIEAHSFVDEVNAMLGARVEHGQFCELWNSIFLPETLIPESLLEAIKNRYRLLLLSNTNSIHFDMIRATYPLVRHFDHYVLSYEVGALKPDARIYEAALAEARCAPEECFYTDDLLPFVEGAKRHGIDAEQFLGLEKLIGDLRSRGVDLG